jgi:hypothetical protein
VAVLLLAGQSKAAAAAQMGVSRATVHRWLVDDFTFQAAMNELQAELYASFRHRLVAMGGEALDTLRRGIDKGDTWAAIYLLRGIGLLSGAPSAFGSADPEELAQEAGEAAKDRRLARKKRRILRALEVSDMRQLEMKAILSG